MTKRKFAFSTDNNMPLYFTSAADGTNVVKVAETKPDFPGELEART